MAHVDEVVGVEQAMSEGVSVLVVPDSKIEEHSLLADRLLTELSQMYG